MVTTEQSEVVPFLGAVRAKKKGREATPPWGAKPPPQVAKRPLLGCGVTLRSSVSAVRVALNVNGF